MPPKLRPVKKRIALTSKPPQHTFENDSNHRIFLSRSLKKSDTELYAIARLNASLKELKEYIVEHFGMDVLLDVGEGIIALSNSSSSSSTTSDGTSNDPNVNGKKEDGEDDGNASTSHEVEELVFRQNYSSWMQKNRVPSNTNTSGSETTSNGTNTGTGATTMNPRKGSDAPATSSGNHNDDKPDQAVDSDSDATIAKEQVEEDSDNSAVTTDDDCAKQSEENPTQNHNATNTNAQNNTNDSHPYYSKLLNDPTFKPVIKNFILRLKLRRKLLNRLARRLLRLSHVMDGKLHKINPPMLPKYGTSFQKHSTSDIKDRVNEWNKDFERREEVLEKLWKKKKELAKEMERKKKEMEDIREKKEKEDIREKKEKEGETVEAAQEANNQERKMEGVTAKVEDHPNEGEQKQDEKNENENKVEIKDTDCDPVKEDNIVKKEEVNENTNDAGMTKEDGDEGTETKVIKHEKEVDSTGDDQKETLESTSKVEKPNADAMDVSEEKEGDIEKTFVKQEQEELSQPQPQQKTNMDVDMEANKNEKIVGDGNNENINADTVTSMEIDTDNTTANAQDGQTDHKKDEAQPNDNKDETSSTTNDEKESKNNQSSDIVMEDVSQEGKTNEVKQEENKVMEKKPDPPETEEVTSKDPKELVSLSSTGVKPNSNISSSPFSFDPFLLDTEHQENMEKLIQYDTDYTKKLTIHIPTKSVIKATTVLTREELAKLDKDEDDFDDNVANDKKNMNHGIGAVSKFMTKKEKVMEWKRWQTEFLSRVPDQPTFEELGMKNRVFFKEERRKLAKKEDDEKKSKGDAEGSDNKKFQEEESGEEGDTKTRKRPREDQSDSIEQDQNKKSADEESKNRKGKDIEKPIVKQKNISLEPVPSFHQQDYSRILMIQSTNLSAALSNTSRETYVQAKNEYDQIFQRSQDLQTRKTVLEAELAKAMYDYRLKCSNITNNIAMAKAKWESDKKTFEKQRIQRMHMKTQMMGSARRAAVMKAMAMPDSHLVKRTMTSMADRVVIRNAPKEHATGSQMTSIRLNRTHPDSISHQVAATMAHCVDVVVRRVESGWLSDAVIDEGKYVEKFPAFVPPTTANPEYIALNAKGETISKIQKRLNADIAKIKSQLDMSEAARSKAWSKLNKAQAGLNNRTGVNPPTQSSKSYRPKATTPAPKSSTSKSGQKSKTSQQTPTQKASSSTSNKTAAASTAGPASSSKANTNSGKSQSSTPSENKYSLERVRARMYSDGSVLPVSMPKKGKDGLYLRPAGRQRKGMDWDPVNGKWVPQNQSRK